MGHYSHIYEAEEEASKIRHEKRVEYDFEELSKAMSIDDKEFLNKIMNSIEDYRTFFKVIRNC